MFLIRDLTQSPIKSESALTELEQKKTGLQRRLSSIEKLDLLINVLTYKIFEAQHEFRMTMEGLIHKKQKLVKRTDIDDESIALEVAELDKEMADLKGMHESAVVNLDVQRDVSIKKNY